MPVSRRSRSASKSRAKVEKKEKSPSKSPSKLNYSKSKQGEADSSYCSADDWFWWADATEIFCWMFSSLSLGLFYNGIGAIAGNRGVEYTDKVILKYDNQLPLQPYMIIPYVIVYFIPSTYVLSSLMAKGVKGSVENVRIFYTVQICMMATCYALYILFPVSVKEISMDPPEENATILTQLTYTFIHSGMTKFCACPSMHVAHCISMAWIQADRKLPGATTTYVFAIITFFSTVLTKAHLIVDVPAGFALALIFDEFLYQPLCRSKMFSIDEKNRKNEVKNPSYKTKIITKLFMMVAIPAIMLYGALWFAEYTGEKIDVLAMFTGKRANCTVAAADEAAVEAMDISVVPVASEAAVEADQAGAL